MWANDKSAQRWLPAIRVRGEGIYLEINHKRLEEWERDNADALASRIAHMQVPDGMLSSDAGDLTAGVSPRFVAIHTLAHLIINRLVYECGYGSASLRERLYVGTSADNPMAGILIYTAAGDSEGTMGGLVRMGRPKRLEQLIVRAVEQAQWCSTDPVCMEAGRGGQGPESCNGAACHDCALLPETSCEMMNRYG